jgi:hypothetical protein
VNRLDGGGQRRTGGFWCLAGGWWPDMVGFEPRAMRVDRLLGEQGIGQDSAAGRQEFERQMESPPGAPTKPMRLVE